MQKSEFEDMSKKCSCNSNMNQLTAKTHEGIKYEYFRCDNCGEEILNMEQLHKVAEKYREMKLYRATLTKWGASLGLRIPKELVQKYKLKNNEKVSIIPEKKGMKVVTK